MDTERCRALLCAIGTGSLTAAAQRLGYTPSGISRMMAALEEQTGMPLLVRSRDGVTPTSACRELMPAMREMIRWAEQYEQTAASLRGLNTGTVSIGTSYTAYYAWLARLIAEFSAVHPGIRVHLTRDLSSELSRAMAERRMDLCIISQREEDCEWTLLRQDELMAWVPENHRLAKAACVPLEAYAAEPFIESHPGQDTDNARIFARSGITPNTRFTVEEVHAAYAMVEAGLGISMVNEVIAYGWQGGVKVLPLSPRQHVAIGIATPADGALSPAARAFVRFAKERVKDL